MKKNAFLLALSMCVYLSGFAQQSGTITNNAQQIGGISKAQFDLINKEGAAKVAAIKPTAAPLSQADKSLLLEIAKGGMKQLAISRAALSKVVRPEVRELVQAEVDEQTGLSAKLKEIAASKNIMLPTEVDTATQSLLSRLEQLSGEEADNFYLSESGIKGHEKLEKVMSKVKASATDTNLKTLATIAHPLVITHLKVANSLYKTSKAKGSEK